MVDQEQPNWVVPNPQICRAFGLMNIIFGAIMLLVGLGTAVAYVVGPMLQKHVMQRLEQDQAKKKAECAAKLDDLKAREAAAKTDEEKDAIQDERAAVEQEVVPDLSAMTDASAWNFFADRRLAVFNVSELAVGVILNLLMIVSGAWLLARAEWARRLAIGVAWGKIVRWVLMVVVTMVLVVPVSMEKAEKTAAQIETQMKAQQGGKTPPLPVATFVRWGVVFGAIIMVFQAIVGSIYPALCLWYLTRPPAIAACLQTQTQTPAKPEPVMDAGGLL